MIRYVLRSILIIAALLLLLISSLKNVYSIGDAGSVNNYVFNILGQLDVLHLLFYALLPALLLLLIVPSLRWKTSHRFAGFIVLLILASAAFLPLMLAPYSFLWPPLRNPNFRIWPIYVALNVLALAWVQFQPDNTKRIKRFARWTFPLTDVLFPSLVWRAHLHGKSRIMPWLRIVPVIILCLLFFLSWIRNPIDWNREKIYNPDMKRIVEGKFWQVMVQPGDDGIIAIRDRQEILLINPDHHGVLAGASHPDFLSVQALALDEESRKLVGSTFDTHTTTVFDSRTLDVLNMLQIKEVPEPSGGCKTYWLPEKQRLLAYCENGLYLLCPDGQTPLAHFRSSHADAEYDPVHEQFLVIGWSRVLVDLDLQTLQPRHELGIPMFSERLEIDHQAQRLYISFPALARIMAVNLEDFTIDGQYSALPGVRVMCVIPQKRWIALAGFTPFIEIRSLDDWSLVQRLYVPIWARWMDYDPDRNELYIATGNGLCVLDLEDIGDNGLRTMLQRTDPFCLALTLGTAVLNLRSGSRGREIQYSGEHVTLGRFQTTFDNRCGPELWYEIPDRRVPQSHGD